MDIKEARDRKFPIRAEVKFYACDPAGIWHELSPDSTSELLSRKLVDQAVEGKWK